jgi:hypothetical protein
VAATVEVAPVEAATVTPLLDSLATDASIILAAEKGEDIAAAIAKVVATTSGTTTTTTTAVTTASQLTGLSGSTLISGFNGLSSSEQATARNALTATQLGEILLSIGIPADRVTFFTSAEFTGPERLNILNLLSSAALTSALADQSDSQITSFFNGINPTIFAELTQAQSVVLVASKSGTDLVNFFAFLDKNFVSVVADALTTTQVTTQTPFLSSPGELSVFFTKFNDGNNDSELAAFLTKLNNNQAVNLIENQGADTSPFTNLNTIFQGLSTTVKVSIFSNLDGPAQSVASPSS